MGSDQYIGIDKAQEIALKSAGLTWDQITSSIAVELDREDAEYEVEFQAGDTKYEYKIDANTGKVLDVDVDRD